jgi:repressor of nif and glnA expression
MSEMWNNAVNEMIQAINSDINIKNFFINFEPNEHTGYVWSQNNNIIIAENIDDLDENIIILDPIE